MFHLNKSINQTLGIKDSQQMFIQANWNAPNRVHTLITTRQGGFSEGKYASLNLGTHVGDDIHHVEYNRALVQKFVPVPVVYLNQIHGDQVVEAKNAYSHLFTADAVVDNTGDFACAVMTADCLPVLFCDLSGSVVAAAHAGWKGLAKGILEQTIQKMNIDSAEIIAYLGPAISQDAFEVGEEVRQIFLASFLQNQQVEQCFVSIGEGKYLADLYQLARLYLKAIGVKQIFGGEYCTVIERERFFSYRRDGQTGRMLSAIWLEK